MPERKCSDWIETYMQYTQQAECPNSYLVWSAISAVASVLQRKVWINMGFFDVYPNMYIVLVGPPGCRKNAAINIATGLAQKIPGVEFSADATTRQALTQTMKALEKTVEVMPGKEGVYKHTSLTIVSKELSVFLGQGNFDFLSLLTDLFDPHDKWEYKTKNMGVDVLNGVWLNILGGSTPAWLVGSIPMNAIGGGFTSRVIFIVEQQPRQRTPRPTITDKELALRADLIHDLTLMSELKGQVNFSPEAGEWFDEWYKNPEKNELTEDPRFHGYFERKHIHLMKVAMILSICRKQELTLQIKELHDALDLLNSAEVTMIHAFGAAGRSLDAQDLDDVLKLLARNGRISKRQLLRNVWRDISPIQVETILRSMLEMGHAIQKRDDKTGETYYYATDDLIKMMGFVPERQEHLDKVQGVYKP